MKREITERPETNQKLRNSIFWLRTMTDQLMESIGEEPTCIDWIEYLNNEEPTPEVTTFIRLKALSAFLSELVYGIWFTNKDDEEALRRVWTQCKDVAAEDISTIINDLIEFFNDEAHCDERASDSRLLVQALKNFRSILMEYELW